MRILKGFHTIIIITAPPSYIPAIDDFVTISSSYRQHHLTLQHAPSSDSVSHSPIFQYFRISLIRILLSTLLLPQSKPFLPSSSLSLCQTKPLLSSDYYSDLQSWSLRLISNAFSCRHFAMVACRVSLPYFFMFSTFRMEFL